MNSRRMVIGLLVAAGIAIVVLLVVPVVHLPYIVVHGPLTALRAQRTARLFDVLMRAAALLFAGLLLPLRSLRTSLEEGTACLSASSPRHLSCSLRC